MGLQYKRLRWTCGLLLGLTVLGAIVSPSISFAANDVNVSIEEWSIHFKNKSVSPGKITFVVHNRGKYTHAFEIDHDGTKVVRSRDIRPGDSQQVTAQLQPGRYDIYCPIDSHKKYGIDAHVNVTAKGISVTSAKANSSSSSSYNSGGSYNY